MQTKKKKTKKKNGLLQEKVAMKISNEVRRWYKGGKLHNSCYSNQCFADENLLELLYWNKTVLGSPNSVYSQDIHKISSISGVFPEYFFFAVLGLNIL